MGQGFFSDFFRILFGISRWFRHLGKSIVTSVTFRRFRGLCDVLLPNRMKYYSIATDHSVILSFVPHCKGNLECC